MCLERCEGKTDYTYTVVLTGMCQAQSPEPQVGRCVGDATQAVLYSVDGLMQKLICKVKLLQQKNKTHQHL